jgi:nitrite reductase/ring-hydroxylating ferredoxin subunit
MASPSIDCIFVCLAAEVEAGLPKRVLLDGYPPLAVFNLGGTFHITDDTCTHGEASLSDGMIEDGEIECPFHLGRFDIRTGQAVMGPCTLPLRVYTTIIDGDRIMLDPSPAS